jgi:S-adenosylmethionine synthetase
VSHRLFTSESVTEGHPDKIADQISDRIVDAYLTQDARARVAVETLITTGQVHIAGEVSSTASVDIAPLVRRTLLSLGCAGDQSVGTGSYGVLVSLDTHAPEPTAGGDRPEQDPCAHAETGADNQGLMYGYACAETPELMPLPVVLAHRLARRLTEVRVTDLVPFLHPDGTAQVTVAYHQGVPARLASVLISTRHTRGIDFDHLLLPEITKHVIEPELQQLDLETEGVRLLISPAGQGDADGRAEKTGATGRKIHVDAYGGVARHGGGAFSGKDPGKIDRCAAYAMRWVAKNIVAAGLAGRCEVQVSYAIGRAEPLGLFVETFGTETVPVECIERAVRELFDLRPAALVRDLDLLRPIYARTATYGHFGRQEADFPWERTDRAWALQKLTGATPASI